MKQQQTTRQHHEPLPGMLPMVIVEGTAYFVDERLQELREVENPAISVPFDSPHGCRLRRSAGLVSCPDCGTMNIAHAPNADRFPCQACGQRLHLRRLLPSLVDPEQVRLDA